MTTSAMVAVLFTDIVGSTSLLSQLGEHRWDGERRNHFGLLRTQLAAHGGTEVKNTGDGLMATFPGAASASECALAMQRATNGARADGSPIEIRIGVAVGEAVFDNDDWFGTPVVEAARLCAAAETGGVLATALVASFAASSPRVTFSTPRPITLKGFDGPVQVVTVLPSTEIVGSLFSQVDDHRPVADRLVGQLDYWETLPDIRRVREVARRHLRLLPGDRVCDIGCGTGTELIEIARLVGPDGQAVGVEPSDVMRNASLQRFEAAGLLPPRIEVIDADGRATGLPAGTFDAVRIERVIQHVGDVDRFVAEGLRLLRPGGALVLVDSDWGSLMVHPGDRSLVRRMKQGFELGPMIEPWAGRTLHAALRAGGATDTAAEVLPVAAERGLDDAMSPLFRRMVDGGLATEEEMREHTAALRAAMDDGIGVYAFCMFVASGRKPVT